MMENLEPLMKLISNSATAKKDMKKMKFMIEKEIMNEINRRVDEEIQNLIIDRFFVQMNQE